MHLRKGFNVALMEIRRISPFFSVSPQIYPAHIECLAALDFKTIFNNRPDHEADDQPLGVELAAEAAKHGVVYVNLPIISGGINEKNVADFSVEIARAKAPVLAFCRSGMRSTILWARHEARHMDADVLISFAAGIGYDLSSSKDIFEQAACSGKAVLQRPGAAF